MSIVKRRWVIAMCAALLLFALMLTGCSESSGRNSYSGGKTYSDYDRYYSDTEIQNFINDYRDTLGW